MIRRLPHDTQIAYAAARTLGVADVTYAPDSSQSDIEDADSVAYRQGYAEGFEAGEEDGRREAERYQEEWERQTKQRLEAELQTIIEERAQLAALLDGLHSQLNDHAVSMEQASFEIALTSLSHAFGMMKDDGELLRRLCTDVVASHRTRAQSLAVSPTDRSMLPALIEGICIREESELTAGQCRIVTAHGDIETSIAIRMAAIYHAMLDTLGVGRS